MTPENPLRAPWLGKLLLEASLIVVSILLALAVDSWREGRQNAARAEQAMTSFEAEIRRNKAALEAILPYHLQLQQEFSRLSAAGEIRKFEDLGKVKGFRGFRPVFLEDTAWSTAVTTGTSAAPPLQVGRGRSYTHASWAREAMQSDGYVHHPVLEAPWTYRVVGFSFQMGEDRSFTRVDLLLVKEEETVRLRFHGVHEFEVEKGFPWVGSGLEILDRSDRGLEHSRIQVESFEQDPTIRFWAQHVERIDPASGGDLGSQERT